MFSNEPLLATSSLWNWVAGEGGWISRSLEQTLQLPDDVHYFDCGNDEAVVVRLQWHIVAIMLSLYYYLFIYIYIYIYLSFLFIYFVFNYALLLPC